MSVKIPFKVLNPDGSPNTTLTKSNVKFKDINNGNLDVTYTSLTKMSLSGHYVAEGFSNWHQVAIYIDDVEMPSFGYLWAGDQSPTFVNATLSGTTVFGGNQDLVGHNITYCNDVQTNSISKGNANGITANDKFVFCGNGTDDTVEFKHAQVQFDADTSTNFHSGDIAHVRNLQVDSFTENTSGNGLSSANRFIVSKGITINGYPVLDESKINTRVRCNEPVFLDGNAGNAQYGNMAITKNWAISEITNRIQPFVNGNYQESVNIIRLMPDATEHYGQIYNTWANALTYSSTAASDLHYITEEIMGAGSNATGITITKVNGKFVADYVHYKGEGAGVNIISDANIQTDEFEATNLGYVWIEDLNFAFLNILMNNNAIFKNIVFKNCSFAGYAQSLTFIDCLFLGTNYIDPIIDDMVIFTNSTGVIYSTKNVISNGVNYPTIYTPTKLGLGTQLLKDNGTAIETHSLSGTGVFSASAMSIGGIYLTNDVTEKIKINGGLKTTDNTGGSGGGDIIVDGNMSASSVIINTVTLHADSSTLSANGGFNFNNNSTLNGDLIVNSKTNSTLKAPNTISLSANVISLTGAIHIDQVPSVNKIEIVCGDGQTYLINVELKT